MPHPPQPLASLQQIYASRSKRDGIPSEVEQDLRVVGCMLIQEVGILLELHVLSFFSQFYSDSWMVVYLFFVLFPGWSRPQSTMATAQVLLHRFFYVSSMLSFSINDTAIAALYLSTKLCETPVRLKELLNVYLVVVHRNRHIRHSRSLDSSFSASTPGAAGAAAPGNSTSTDTNTSHQAQPHSLPLSSSSNDTLETPIDTIVADFVYQPPPGHASIWWTMKDAICTGEMQILKRLGFNMQVDLPYSHIVNYCKILDLVALQGVVQHCWAILNDALQTPIYTHHPPPTIACASIFLACRLRRIPLPDHWWVLFDADEEDMVACCAHIMRLWARWGNAINGTAQVSARGEEGTMQGGGEGDGLTHEQKERWSRSWKMASSRHYVRSWVRDRTLEGEHGWIDV